MLNTQRIIDTLRSAPCNWFITPTEVFGISPEYRADCEVQEHQSTMQCVFSPDLPEHIAVRNMNYLLAFVAAAGASIGVKDVQQVISIVGPDHRIQQYTSEFVRNMLHITLTIDKQCSITTVTIRTCKARVYGNQ